jgi:protein-L-isoaspartate(D-aspartate) O-methyltransferase
MDDLGYDNVHISQGDGTLGWPEHAPYDNVVVTAGGPIFPKPCWNNSSWVGVW